MCPVPPSGDEYSPSDNIAQAQPTAEHLQPLSRLHRRELRPLRDKHQKPKRQLTVLSSEG